MFSPIQRFSTSYSYFTTIVPSLAETASLPGLRPLSLALSSLQNAPNSPLPSLPLSQSPPLLRFLVRLSHHGGADILVCRGKRGTYGRQECLPHRAHCWLFSPCGEKCGLASSPSSPAPRPSSLVPRPLPLASRLSFFLLTQNRFLATLRHPEVRGGNAAR
jgi:hypothetical protein